MPQDVLNWQRSTSHRRGVEGNYEVQNPIPMSALANSSYVPMNKVILILLTAVMLAGCPAGERKIKIFR